MIEDHTLIGQALIGLLRTLPGIGDVHLATTVADAIAVAADHDIDLVILDLLLPDGNGLDALRAVMRWHWAWRAQNWSGWPRSTTRPGLEQAVSRGSDPRTGR
jgi:DNA-binding NarL/FixJ family response regulator